MTRETTDRPRWSESSGSSLRQRFEHEWTPGVEAAIRWVGLIGLGTSPFRIIGLRTAPGSGTGTAESSALV